MVWAGQQTLHLVSGCSLERPDHCSSRQGVGKLAEQSVDQVMAALAATLVDRHDDHNALPLKHMNQGYSLVILVSRLRPLGGV
jgi:hypothetical protein